MVDPSRDHWKRMEEFARLCRAEGLTVTAQRRAVFAALLARVDHPTAEQIWNDVRNRLPDVSRMTVYRVLETLVRIGVAATVSHHGGVCRYDGNVDRHHHLVCTNCDRVIDIHDAGLDAAPIPDTRPFHFCVSSFSVQLRGLCRACRNSKSKRTTGRPLVTMRSGRNTSIVNSGRSRRKP